jgi:FkbM family methyltransferase
MELPYVNPQVLRLRRLWWRLLGRFRSTLTVRTPQGVYEVSLRDELIGKVLYLWGVYERAETRDTLDFLRSRGMLPPKGQGTVLDVGANIGVTSVGLLVEGGLARAIAVEPEPGNFDLLVRNVGRNNLTDRFVCLNRAASDRAGAVEFELSRDNFGDHRVRVAGAKPPAGPDRFGEADRAVIRVQAERLDDMLRDLPPKFVDELAIAWFDVQGHEAHAFRGARQLLARGFPVVAEVGPYWLERAGTRADEFCRLVADLWPRYWVRRRAGRFVPYPTTMFHSLLDELGTEGELMNVVFTR